MIYFLLILFFASLFSIVFMIGRKLIFLKNEEIKNQEEILLELPYLKEVKNVTVAGMRKHGYSLLVAIIRSYIRFIKFLKDSDSSYVIVDAKIEEDLKDMDAAEKGMFRVELGAKDDGINNLISEGYKMLDLITYFTTGEKETRAWTITRGATAPEAGAVIHNDFKDKFIRAETVNWATLIADGSWSQARDKGDIRTEGKTYVVADGDVMVFLHS